MVEWTAVPLGVRCFLVNPPTANRRRQPRALAAATMSVWGKRNERM